MSMMPARVQEWVRKVKQTAPDNQAMTEPRFALDYGKAMEIAVTLESLATRAEENSNALVRAQNDRRDSQKLVRLHERYLAVLEKMECR